jgi:prophage regulatory protein
MQGMQMRVLGYRDLARKGIPYSRQHINRLVKKGKFPAPFKLNGGHNGPNSWLEHIIDRHIETCAAKHDNGSSKSAASSEQGVQAA